MLDEDFAADDLPLGGHSGYGLILTRLMIVIDEYLGLRVLGGDWTEGFATTITLPCRPAATGGFSSESPPPAPAGRLPVGKPSSYLNLAGTGRRRPRPSQRLASLALVAGWIRARPCGEAHRGRSGPAATLVYRRSLRSLRQVPWSCHDGPEGTAPGRWSRRRCQFAGRSFCRAFSAVHISRARSNPHQTYGRPSIVRSIEYGKLHEFHRRQCPKWDPNHDDRNAGPGLLNSSQLEEHRLIVGTQILRTDY